MRFASNKRKRVPRKSNRETRDGNRPTAGKHILHVKAKLLRGGTEDKAESAERKNTQSTKTSNALLDGSSFFPVPLLMRNLFLEVTVAPSDPVIRHTSISKVRCQFEQDRGEKEN